MIAKLMARPRANVLPVPAPASAAGTAGVGLPRAQPATNPPHGEAAAVSMAARMRAPRTEVLKPDGTRVALSDLVSSGIIPVDAALEAEFGGVTHVARVRADGVEFGGTLYSNLSAAAGAARGGASNGWSAWLYQGRPVGQLRDEFLRRLDVPSTDAAK